MESRLVQQLSQHSYYYSETSIRLFTEAMDKTIAELALVDNELRFTFADGSKISMRDGGQQCCEHRYMRTDDNLNDFIGAVLWDAEIMSAPNVVDPVDRYIVHEVQFLEVETDRGVFTMSNHNDHNGYYGGFDLMVTAGPGT